MNAEDRPDPVDLSAELSAYLDGELSPADAARVERALENDPALRAELERLEEISATLRGLPTLSAPSSVMEGIRRETAPRPSSFANFGSWAALFLVAALGMIAWGSGAFGPSSEVDQLAREDSVAAPAPRTFEKSTGTLEESTLEKSTDKLGKSKQEPAGGLGVAESESALSENIAIARNARAVGEESALGDSDEVIGGKFEQKKDEVRDRDDRVATGRAPRPNVDAVRGAPAPTPPTAPAEGERLRAMRLTEEDGLVDAFDTETFGTWGELGATEDPSPGVQVRYRWSLSEQEDAPSAETRQAREETAPSGVEGETAEGADLETPRGQYGQPEVQDSIDSLEWTEAADLTLRVPVPSGAEARPDPNLPVVLAGAIIGRPVAAPTPPARLPGEERENDPPTENPENEFIGLFVPPRDAGLLTLEIEVPEDRLLETMLALRSWHRGLVDSAEDSDGAGDDEGAPNRTTDYDRAGEKGAASDPADGVVDGGVDGMVNRLGEPSDLVSAQDGTLVGFAYEAPSARLGLLLEGLGATARAASPVDTAIEPAPDAVSRQREQALKKSTPPATAASMEDARAPERPLRIRIVLEPAALPPETTPPSGVPAAEDGR